MLNTKEDHLKFFVVAEEPNVVGPHWLSIVVTSINFLITSNLQNNLFYVQHKKETHTGLEQHEGEKIMTKFKFLGELSL